jgi:hypothetical protein
VRARSNKEINPFASCRERNQGFHFGSGETSVRPRRA